MIKKIDRKDQKIDNKDQEINKVIYNNTVVFTSLKSDTLISNIVKKLLLLS